MEITKEQILHIPSSILTKKEAIEYLSRKCKELKITSSWEKLNNAFLKREDEGSTGFENGFAIPHARIPEIKRNALVIGKFDKPIDWDSMDGKPTEVFLAICVPSDSEAADNHMRILSSLSMRLIDEDFQKILKEGKDSEIVEEVNKIFNKSDDSSINNEQKDISNNKKVNIVAVTACSTGIAHTFMAAKKLEDAAKTKDINIKVQKNGASGPEDKLTEEDILNADYVIIASDVNVDLEPFEGKKLVKVPVAYAIKSTNELIDSLESDAQTYGDLNNDPKKSMDIKSKKQKSSWFYRNILTHVMSGVSHIIPLLVSAGILLAFGKLLASFTGDVAIADNYEKLFREHGDNFWFKIVYLFNISGIVVLWMLFPIFGLFTANSIGGKNAIIPGFMAGIFADGDHLFARIWRTFNTKGLGNPFPSDSYPFIQTSAGFFGVLVGAILIGYVVFYLNKWIKLKGNFAPLKSILLVPGISILIVVILQIFIINPPFALLNLGIKELVIKFQSFVIVFALFVAFCTAFDLGGPVNKAVGAVAIGLAADGTIPLSARTVSIVIPPIGLGIATLIAKPLFRKDLYDQDLKIAGRTSIFLGLIAITEGGLPFLFKKPLTTITSSVLGAMAGALFVTLVRANMWQPLPAVYGWPLVGLEPENAAYTSNLSQGVQILMYVISVIIGVAVTTFTDIGLRLWQWNRVPSDKKTKRERKTKVNASI